MDPLTCTTCQRPITSPYLYRSGYFYRSASRDRPTYLYPETFAKPEAAFHTMCPPERRFRRLVFRCLQCGAETDVGPTHSTFRTRPAARPDLRRRYCSVECRTEAARLRARAERQAARRWAARDPSDPPMWRGAPDPATCPLCLSGSPHRRVGTFGRPVHLHPGG